jgi:hypothetical protein
MIALLTALNRLGLVTRLLLAVAGFGICLSGTVVDLTFGDSTVVIVIAWALRVAGFLIAALFFATMVGVTGSSSKREASADVDEQHDLAHNYRIDNWNNRDYWGDSHKDLD